MTVDLSRALPYFSKAQAVDETAPIHAFGSLDGPIVRFFSNTLLVTYMIDEPGAQVPVRERDVERGARDVLHARAVDNLRAYTRQRKLRFTPKGPTYVAALDGQHDASLLLLDELWDPPTRIADFDGELVVAVPSRDVIVFTGRNIEGGIEELRKLTSEDVSLSPELFVRRNGAWETFEG